MPWFTLNRRRDAFFGADLLLANFAREEMLGNLDPGSKTFARTRKYRDRIPQTEMRALFDNGLANWIRLARQKQKKHLRHYASTCLPCAMASRRNKKFRLEVAKVVLHFVKGLPGIPDIPAGADEILFILPSKDYVLDLSMYVFSADPCVLAKRCAEMCDEEIRRGKLRPERWLNDTERLGLEQWIALGAPACRKLTVVKDVSELA